MIFLAVTLGFLAESLRENMSDKEKEKNTYIVSSATSSKIQQAFNHLYMIMQQIKIFFNEVSSERGWTKNYIGNMKNELPKATSLIAFLKKEYEIE